MKKLDIQPKEVRRKSFSETMEAVTYTMAARSATIPAQFHIAKSESSHGIKEIANHIRIKQRVLPGLKKKEQP